MKNLIKFTIGLLAVFVIIAVSCENWSGGSVAIVKEDLVGSWKTNETVELIGGNPIDGEFIIGRTFILHKYTADNNYSLWHDIVSVTEEGLAAGIGTGLYEAVNATYEATFNGLNATVSTSSSDGAVITFSLTFTENKKSYTDGLYNFIKG